MLGTFLFLWIPASALYFSLEPIRERCIGVRVAKDQMFTGAYVVSGEGEYNVLTRVSAPDGSVLYQSQRLTREGKFELKAVVEGNHKLCFRAFDRRPKSVSFDLRCELDKEEPVHDEELVPLHMHVGTMRREFERVERNVQFTIAQERAHRDLAEQTCDRVLWSALLKLCVLSLVSFAEIYVLKGFFTDKETQKV